MGGTRAFRIAPGAGERSRAMTVAYYVVGGEYADTSFQDLLKPEPVVGPFEHYEQAFNAWRGRAMATIDQAYVRFQIVKSDRAPVVTRPRIVRSA
jgi:hypothetical protein